MQLTREQVAREIRRRMETEQPGLIQQWRASDPIRHFVLDDLLPEEWTRRIRAAFPNDQQMVLKRSLRELKFIAAQMDRYDRLLEESIYAFQAAAILDLVQQITGLGELEPDESLYAGGISSMGPGHFVNPHVDNSHDKFRSRYRVLNLLFYVSPDWSEADGCNLELWPNGLAGRPTTIVSRFNRLVVMITHEGSWHSVSPNRAGRNRCCVSNYYFSRQPAGSREYFHVTRFRGRPGQPMRDLVLRADSSLRMAIRKVFPRGIRENPHFYDRSATGTQWRESQEAPTGRRGAAEGIPRSASGATRGDRGPGDRAG
jgi:Rps23 Pro-64 3,4-dihydroxylase Tpa1-like proline 4-hydroxylase